MMELIDDNKTLMVILRKCKYSGFVGNAPGGITYGIAKLTITTEKIIILNDDGSTEEIKIKW